MIGQVIVVALAIVTGVACSDSDELAQVTTTTTSEARAKKPVSRLVLNPRDDEMTAAAARFEGVLLAEECVVLESGGIKRVAVWPQGATLFDEGVKVGDRVLRFGEKIVIGGGEANSPEHLADLGADHCGPSAAWIVGGLE